jgi:hypothetical protein
MKVGDLVEITYKNVAYIGKIRSIYNNGDTINVSFNNCCTAFYYKNVRPCTLQYIIRQNKKIIIKL